MKYFFILILSISLSHGASQATKDVITSNTFYKYDHIFKKAEREYAIPFVLLKAIALTESSFNEKAVCNNSNKTKDVGLMQINTIWQKEFNIHEKDLKKVNNNIEAAAKILHNLIRAYGYSWDTIGRYHSSTPEYKKKWLKKVKRNMAYIMAYDKRYNYKMVASK